MPEELLPVPPPGFDVAGRYKDRATHALEYAAMALVKSKPVLIEILVTECDSEPAARDLVRAAMAPYL